MFLGSVKHSIVYRFLVLNSVIIERNNSRDKKNVKFFEHVLPLKNNGTSKQSIYTTSDAMGEDVMRSKRQRKETSFGDDFYTYLVENYPTSYLEDISSLDAKHWGTLGLKLIQLRKLVLGP